MVKALVEIPKDKGAKPVMYREYTDNETGEVIQVPVIFHDLKNQASNNDFEMIFYGHMMNVIDDLGNKKIKVLKYLVSKRDKYNNTLIKTVREIAKDLGLSLTTVNSTLVYLEDKGVIKRKTGAIFLDADLICDGRFKGRIMHVYNSIESETAEERNARLQREIKRKLAEAEALRNLVVEIQPENQTELEFGLSH